MDPEDLNKDVLKSFPVIFDVKILLENWPTGQATINRTIAFQVLIWYDNDILGV